MSIKKILSSLAILIVVFSFFTPINEAGAQVFHCSIHDSAFDNVSACEEAGGTWDYGTTSATGISAIIIKVEEIINTSIPVLITLGLAYFIWGVVQYMIGGGEEAKK